MFIEGISGGRSVLLTKLYSDDQIKKMRWAGQVAGMGKRKGYTGFWWKNLSERGHLEDPG
jgi:hypothetical protein